MIRLLHLLLFLLLYTPMPAQTAFSVRADRQQILIGEPLRLEVRLTASSMPVWMPLDTFPFFEVLHRTAVDTLQQGDRITLQQTLTLTSWDSGLRVIPAIRYGPGRASAPLPVAVRFSSPFDPRQPYHEERDIEEVEVPKESNWQWYLVILLLLIGLAALMFPARKKDATALPKPDQNYYRKVLQRLQQLEQDDRLRSDAKGYYTELVRIFRDYLYRRKGYFSDADTTADLVARMGQWRLQESMQQELRIVLQESDLVKFAKYNPGTEAFNQATQTIKKAVIAIEEHS